MRTGVIALLVAAACASGPTATASGIDALVVLGPTCPVQRADEPCHDRPYQVSFRIIDRASGRAVATARSDADGRLHLPLAPGEYTIEPILETPLPHASPVDVTVEPGRFTEVTITFDSGIR